MIVRTAHALAMLAFLVAATGMDLLTQPELPGSVMPDWSIRYA